ncbi:MAG: VanZ family protein [Streptosporangiaceae bacterium]
MGLLTRSTTKPASPPKKTAAPKIRVPKQAKPRQTTPGQTPRRKRSLGFRLLRALLVLVALGALGVFAYWAYLFTLRPVSDPNGWAVGNTEPGHTLKFYLDRPNIKEAVKAIGGNLALLAPLGILLPMVFPRLRGVVRLTFLVALISLGIEVVQGVVISGRTFDVDDIILNTLGAAIAYLLLGRRVSKFVHGAKRPLFGGQKPE